MSDYYKIVDPTPIKRSEQEQKRLDSCLYRGNYGAVYPEADGSLTYEFQTGALGDPLRKSKISQSDLTHLLSGDLIEDVLLRRLGY